MPFGRLFLCLAVMLLLVAGDPARAERRVAMVIGIDDYTHDALPDLKNARKDARGVASILEELGFEVTLLIDANRREFSRALDAFEGKLRNADVGLMFYAGHGVQADGVNWLIPADAAIDIEADLRLGGVDAMEFLDAMERSGGLLNILILDACRDNPLPSRKRSTAKGLAPLSSRSGRTAIIYAASPGQTAADGKPGEHSVFTGELIQALNVPGLTLEDVFKTTAARVSERTGGRQLPWMNTSFTGTFHFRAPEQVEKPADQPQQDRAQLQMEALFWQTIKDSRDPGDYAAYLNQFPGGTFAQLARSRMEAYARLAQQPPARAELPPEQVAAVVPATQDGMEGAEGSEIKVTPLDEPVALDPLLAEPSLDVPVEIVSPIVPKKKPVEAIEMASLTRSARVKADGRVNLRRGPGVDFPVVDKLSARSELVVLGTERDGEWYRVARVGGRAGYILASLLDADVSARSGAGPTAVSAQEEFRDCPQCPEMVVVTPGRFLIGDLHFGGESSLVGEYPVRQVDLSHRFAVGKFELTQAQWSHFMGENPSQFQDPDRPVENVSFDDVQIYLRRLNAETGRQYRLLSEAEWEYVTRAGTTTVFPWGNDMETGKANCEDCGSQWGKKETAPVGSFPPNALGMFDLAGNVREWTADCMTESYESLPTDGSAQIDGDCTVRMTRGGGWDDDAQQLRSAARGWSFAGDRTEKVGFRVAVTLQ